MTLQLGLPLPQRKQLINQLASGSSEIKARFRFQGSVRQFDVFKVRIEMPKYRLSNGRTQALQEQLLESDQSLPRDLFEADQESDQAQRQQHSLLRQLMNEANLYSYFTTHEQEEPLVLTNLGIVVNGNRRLCAMRELLESDPEEYSRFKNIQVVILPACDEKDVDELEAELQIREDIKASYSWIAEACMMRRRQQDRGYDDATLARIYGKKPEDVREELDKLTLADQYLEWKQTPKKYADVEGDEFAFKSLRSELARVHDERKAALGKGVAFHLIRYKPEGTGRLNTFIPGVFKALPVVEAKLALELGGPPVAPLTIAVSTEGGAAADIALLGPSGPEFAASPLLGADDRSDSVSSVIVDAVEGAKARSRELKHANSVLADVTEANTLIRGATIALSTMTYKAEIQLQVSALEDAVVQFKAKLKGYVGPEVPPK
jgi:hypothetical protein